MLLQVEQGSFDDDVGSRLKLNTIVHCCSEQTRAIMNHAPAICVGIPVEANDQSGEGKGVIVGSPAVGPAPRESGGSVRISSSREVRLDWVNHSDWMGPVRGELMQRVHGYGDDDDDDSVVLEYEMTACCGLCRALLGATMVLSGLLYMIISVATRSGGGDEGRAAPEWAYMAALIGILVGMFVWISGNAGRAAGNRVLDARRVLLRRRRRRGLVRMRVGSSI